MDSNMHVKITDLGFAVQLDENETLHEPFGTPGKYHLLIYFLF